KIRIGSSNSEFNNSSRTSSACSNSSRTRTGSSGVSSKTSSVVSNRRIRTGGSKIVAGHNSKTSSAGTNSDKISTGSSNSAASNRVSSRVLGVQIKGSACKKVKNAACGSS